MRIPNASKPSQGLGLDGVVDVSRLVIIDEVAGDRYPLGHVNGDGKQCAPGPGTCPMGHRHEVPQRFERSVEVITDNAALSWALNQFMSGSTPTD